MKEYFMYFDESGNLGTSGKYFVIACIITENRKALHNTMKKTLKKIKSDYHNAKFDGHELKANKATKEIKSFVLNRISKNNLEISYIVAEKQHVQEQLIKDQNRFYNFLLKILLDQHKEKFKENKINLILDNKTIKVKSLNSFEDYINIHINSFYKEILNDESSDIVAKEFIKDRLDSALNLIKSIEHRKSTTIMIANSILNKQKDFFEKGIHYIKPMKMQELAQELNIHQSTISRGVNGKYMLTPFGLFEFKYFFSKGLETQETEGVSSISIKKFIKDTIKNEDKSKPLSDEKIKVMLNNQGINIARRTVSKYREELEILPSSKRKTLISK